MRRYGGALLTAVLCAGVIVTVVGTLSVQARSRELGLLLGWDLSPMTVVGPAPAVLQYSIMGLLGLLAMGLFGFFTLRGSHRAFARLAAGATSLLLFAVIAWTWLSTTAEQLVSVKALAEGALAEESVFVVILRQAGLSPSVHLIAGFLALLVMMSARIQPEETAGAVESTTTDTA